jgi:hypothetical protein
MAQEAAQSTHAIPPDFRIVNELLERPPFRKDEGGAVS